MSPFQDQEFGGSTISFMKDSLPEALRKIRSLGLRSVDLVVIPGLEHQIDWRGGIRQAGSSITSTLRSSGLSLASFNTYLGDLGNAEADWPALMGSYLELFELAGKLGAAVVTLPSPPRREAGSNRERLKRAAGFYLDLASRTEGSGVALTVEAPHGGTCTQTQEETVELWRMVRDAGVYWALDTSHLGVAAVPVEECFATYGSLVKHVHLRDAKARDIHVTPGDGDFAWGPFFRSLSALGYRGDMTLELEYGSAPGIDVEQEYRRALAFLQKTLRG